MLRSFYQLSSIAHFVSFVYLNISVFLVAVVFTDGFSSPKFTWYVAENNLLKITMSEKLLTFIINTAPKGVYSAQLPSRLVTGAIYMFFIVVLFSWWVIMPHTTVSLPVDRTK